MRICSVLISDPAAHLDRSPAAMLLFANGIPQTKKF
jgi:hypothetical protein